MIFFSLDMISVKTNLSFFSFSPRTGGIIRSAFLFPTFNSSAVAHIFWAGGNKQEIYLIFSLILTKKRPLILFFSETWFGVFFILGPFFVFFILFSTYNLIYVGLL